MVKALIDELILRKEYLGKAPVETVYFGGGTPSVLSGRELQLIFEALREHFAIDDGAEITLEANPDDLTADVLSMYRDWGINRLSIGIQSFDDDVLRSLNRLHNGMAARRSVEKHV